MELVGPAKSVYDVGDRIDYQCKPGFARRPSESTFTLCGANDNWLPLSNDACYKKSCPTPTDPLNGQVNLLNGSYEFGTQIEFVCNNGFYLIGDKILHCLLSGSNVHWSNEAPLCEKILCEPPPKITNGDYSPSEDVFQHLQVVTYTCKRISGPDQFSLIGKATLHCVGGDVWSDVPPECKMVKCPFPALPHGRQTSGFGVKHYYKATVMFECDQGFFLHGSDTVICEADSTWQPPVPKCLRNPLTTNTAISSSPESSSTESSGPESTGSQSNGPESSGSQSGEGRLDCEHLGGWVVGLLVTIFLQEH
ncbi:Membrane cofactor protein [Fukomys damarensis]|uniref:Complement component receptor 1-like protein n=3 Tax=Fukomys damarensis TaxID=885580 RepID=A0A091D0C9_FUKDA|nr:Membrane cofactor protein [Fukomys damarensis]